jgi:hypothetical protein
LQPAVKSKKGAGPHSKKVARLELFSIRIVISISSGFSGNQIEHGPFNGYGSTSNLDQPSSTCDRISTPSPDFPFKTPRFAPLSAPFAGMDIAIHSAINSNECDSTRSFCERVTGAEYAGRNIETCLRDREPVPG